MQTLNLGRVSATHFGRMREAHTGPLPYADPSGFSGIQRIRRKRALRDVRPDSGPHVSSGELVKQCRGLLEVGVREAFSDAGDNRYETGFGFVAAIVRSEKMRERLVAARNSHARAC